MFCLLLLFSCCLLGYFTKIPLLDTFIYFLSKIRADKKILLNTREEPKRPWSVPDEHGPWIQTVGLSIIVLAPGTQGKFLSLSTFHFKNGNNNNNNAWGYYEDIEIMCVKNI